MGDFLQILVIIGAIAFVLIKQFIKANAEVETEILKEKRQKNDDPEYMSEEEFKNGPEPFLSYDYDYPDSPASSVPSEFWGKTKSTSDRKQLKKESPEPLVLSEETVGEQEFDIHSTEEVRRAIIWSEILNRKY